MLTLDMTGLTEAELAQTVTRHLAPFGNPTILQVVPRNEVRRYGLAAVKMSTPEAAERLAAMLGDSQCSSMVIIRLVQPGHGLPSGWHDSRRVFGP